MKSMDENRLATLTVWLLIAGAGLFFFVPELAFVMVRWLGQAENAARWADLAGIARFAGLVCIGVGFYALVQLRKRSRYGY